MIRLFPRSVWALLTVLLPATALAQTGSLLSFYEADNGYAFGREATIMAQQRQVQMADIARTAGLTTPLEGAIDPEVYRVGPNDVFQVTVGGLNAFQVPVAVSSDGYLVLPDAGRIAVAGRTLAEAETMAGEALRANYRNVEVEIALAQPRQFYVHVGGAVPEPGRYVALPVARVDDVLRQAFFSEHFDPVVINMAHRPALRNVHIRHADGTEQSVDLVAYYRTGDPRHNPYLRDGDAVRVPAFLPSEQAVFVDGELAFPGQYDFRPGDTILDALRVADGPIVPGRTGSVRLSRRLPDGSWMTELYDLTALTAPGAEPVPLQALDNVHVPRTENLMGVAKAEGFVRYPGTYPIVLGRSTLRDLVDAAGGFHPDALVHGAYLIRPDVEEAREAERPMTEEERLAQRQYGPYLFLSDTSAVLSDLQLGVLDFISRYDLVRSMRFENRVSIDVEAALADGAPPVLLRDGDVLYVPRDEGTVRVLGQVMRPGAVAYKPGLSASDYIRAVGGRAPKGDDLYVVQAGSGQILPGWDAPLRSGDVVFVERRGGMPMTPELERLALQQRADRRSNRQFIIGVVSATFAAVINAFTIRELIRRD